ncbi:hypothetical protein ACP70R_020829 [Stipagrostis hirtigluma subsp. patula]
MVKIVEIKEKADADGDDDCCEIDASEFAKKANLKETDDVIVVTAKGKIKVEVDQSEDFAKPSDGYGSEADCVRINGFDVTLHNRHEFATGDSKDNPYRIDEDEPTLLQVQIDEDRFALDKSSSKLVADDHKNWKQLTQGDKDERRSDSCDATPHRIVVKREFDDHDVVDGDACDHCLEMTGPSQEVPRERRVFDEEDDEDVVVVEREAP